MKRIISPAALMIFLLLPLRSVAETRLSFGGRLSLNLANIAMPTGSGEVLNGDFKSIAVYGVGLVVQVPVTSEFSVGVGFGLDQLGGRYIEEHDFGGAAATEDVKAVASYVSLPILTRYTYSFGNDWGIFGTAGLYLAFLLSGRAEGEINGDSSLTIDEDIKDYAESLDYGLVLGAGVQRLLGSLVLFAEIQYRWEFRNGLRDDGLLGGLGLSAKNSALTLSLGLMTTKATTRVRVDTKEPPR